MGKHLSLINTDSIAKQKRVESAYTDYVSVVTNVDGESDFVIAGGTVTANGKIDVLINGVVYYEGADTEEWQRDTENNKIVTNRAIPKNAEVIVRLYEYE